MKTSLSPRANKALTILKNGGVIIKYTLYAGTRTRFEKDGAYIPNLGEKTHRELRAAGFKFEHKSLRNGNQFTLKQ